MQLFFCGFLAIKLYSTRFPADILGLDDMTPMIRRRLLPRSGLLHHPSIPIPDLSALQVPHQLRFQRLFSTTTRACDSEVQPEHQDQSSQKSTSTVVGQSPANSMHEDMGHESVTKSTAIPPTSPEESQDHTASKSVDEVYQVVSKSEEELEVLRDQLQILVSQRSDNYGSASIMNDQTSHHEEPTNSVEFGGEESGPTKRLPKIKTRFCEPPQHQLSSRTSQARLSHLDRNSAVHMVSVSDKAVTKRTATAVGSMNLPPSTVDAIVSHSLEKGDVLSVARIAAIQAVKKTSDTIPLCHPGLSIEGIKVDIRLIKHGSVFPVSNLKEDESSPLLYWMGRAAGSASCLKMSVTVESSGKTGVEMEALNGVTVGLLTVYDMCKSTYKGAAILTRLWSKKGGKSGKWSRYPEGDVKSAKENSELS